MKFSILNFQFSIFLFFLIIFLGILLFPLVSLAAGTYRVCLNESCQQTANICYEGLVPCGGVLYKGAEIENGRCKITPAVQVIDDIKKTQCQLCHFFIMLDGIIDFVILILVPVVAVLMLVIGGVMFMVAHFGGAELLPGGVKGGPAMLSQAKRLITSVIQGLVIIFAAWLIINTFFMIIGVANWTGLRAGWFSIDCPVILPP